MNYLSIAKFRNVDWVSLFSLLVIAMALLALLKNFSGGDDAAGQENISVDSQTGGPVEVLERKSLQRVQTAAQGAIQEKSPGPEIVEIKPVELLGVSIQLRELRTASAAGEAGQIRNIEFFIRDGILPRQLFTGTSQRVTGYWPLFHNNVGYGASTVRILYQLVEADSDGDGELTGADSKSLAFSLPDGSHYRVLDRDVGDIAEMTYLSDSSELQLEFLRGGEMMQRVYSLAVRSH